LFSLTSPLPPYLPCRCYLLNYHCRGGPDGFTFFAPPHYCFSCLPRWGFPARRNQSAASICNPVPLTCALYWNSVPSISILFRGFPHDSFSCPDVSFTLQSMIRRAVPPRFDQKISAIPFSPPLFGPPPQGDFSCSDLFNPGPELSFTLCPIATFLSSLFLNYTLLMDALVSPLRIIFFHHGVCHRSSTTLPRKFQILNPTYVIERSVLFFNFFMV